MKAIQLPQAKPGLSDISGKTDKTGLMPGTKCGPQAPTPRPRARVQFGPPSSAPTPPVIVESEKPKRPPKPKVKNDPKFVAAARELRDRYLEHVNGAAALATARGKYDVGRQIESSSTTVTTAPLLPAA